MQSEPFAFSFQTKQKSTILVEKKTLSFLFLNYSSNFRFQAETNAIKSKANVKKDHLTVNASGHLAPQGHLIRQLVIFTAAN
jgi:hypothetical protein